MSGNRVDRFLTLMQNHGASDLHLSVGRTPILRLWGRLEPIRYRVLTDEDFAAFLEPITPPETWARFLETGDADYAYAIPGVARFRVNLFKQERGLAAVFRLIPDQILTVGQLGLPKSVEKLFNLRGGLVLVTGPTGSGKSTTLASIIHEMNKRRALHFVTLEDPIEFVHENQQSLVSQREVHTHTASFSAALRAAVREDPDVILVGEMRDLETISMALNAAETGVLVFGTLHTNDAVQSINRLIDVFPAHQQQQVRTQLSFSLEGVFSQQLITRADGRGRVLACEILLSTAAVRALIRDDKAHQVPSVIQTGAKLGMRTMNQSLYELYRTRQITYEEAISRSSDGEELKRIFQRQD